MSLPVRILLGSACLFAVLWCFVLVYTAPKNASLEAFIFALFLLVAVSEVAVVGVLLMCGVW